MKLDVLLNNYNDLGLRAGRRELRAGRRDELVDVSTELVDVSTVNGVQYCTLLRTYCI